MRFVVSKFIQSIHIREFQSKSCVIRLQNNLRSDISGVILKPPIKTVEFFPLKIVMLIN